MSLFSRCHLEKDQLESMAAQASCSIREIRSRASVARKMGMDESEFEERGLFKLSKPELSSYLKSSSPRKYVEALSDESELDDCEVYLQLAHAKNDFGIPYSSFAKKNLLNASDERLEKVAEQLKGKDDNMVKKIADSMAMSEEDARRLCEEIYSNHGYGIREIFINRLYEMSDEDIERYKESKTGHSKEVIERIVKETGWPASQVLSHISHCNIDFGIDKAIYLSSRCYERDDDELARFGTMADSKKLAAMYNKGHSHILSDKSLFNKTYKDYIGRKFWVNRDTDFEEFSEFAEGLDALFCKPIDSSIGRGTYKVYLHDGSLREMYETFMDRPKYLIEECVEPQHPDMAAFYPDSLNTVRLFTILYDGKFEAFMSFVRFGVSGIIDNFSSGGIACAVDPKTGKIITHASNKDGDIYTEHPISKIKFKGFQIPFWDEVLERSEAALRAVDGVNYVGWDVAFKEDGIVFIEGNSSPDLGVQQSLCLTEDMLIRSDYYKYFAESAYDDMLEKVLECKARYGCGEGQALKRLEACAEHGIEYPVVLREELCRMTSAQIHRYMNKRKIHRLVDRVAKDNGASVAEAFLQMRTAEKEHGVSFADFADNGLFGAEEGKVAHFVES